jgi:hypothetical protein
LPGGSRPPVFFRATNLAPESHFLILQFSRQVVTDETDCYRTDLNHKPLVATSIYVPPQTAVIILSVSKKPLYAGTRLQVVVFWLP